MLISDTALSARGLSTGPPRFRIVQSLTVNWDLLTLVQKLNFRFKWSQRNLVTSVKSYVWIILNSLTKEFTFVWDVERDVVVVRGCRNYVVASSNRVAPCQTACPAPTKTISNSLILRWDLGLAKSVLNLSWDQDLNLITETSPIILNWHLGIQPPACDGPILSEFVYSQTLEVGRYLTSMEFSENGEFLYTGYQIDRNMRSYISTGVNWDITDYSYVGPTWSDERQAIETSGSDGNMGRQQCNDIMADPNNNPPEWIMSSHDSTLSGHFAKWVFPDDDWNGSPLVPGTFDAGALNSGPDNLQGGLILTEYVSNNYQGIGSNVQRVYDFKISKDGTRMLARANLAGVGLDNHFDLEVPWSLTTAGGAWNQRGIVVSLDSPSAYRIGSNFSFWCDDEGLSLYTMSTSGTITQYCTSEAWTATPTTIPADTTPVEVRELSAMLPAGQLPITRQCRNIKITRDKTRLYVIEMGSNGVTSKIHQFNR